MQAPLDFRVETGYINNLTILVSKLGLVYTKTFAYINIDLVLRLHGHRVKRYFTHQYENVAQSVNAVGFHACKRPKRIVWRIPTALRVRTVRLGVWSLSR